MVWRHTWVGVLVSAAVIFMTQYAAAASEITVQVTVEADLEADLPADGLEGRLIVILAASDQSEPRFQTNGWLNGAQVFGQTFEGVRSGDTLTVAADTAGFPVKTMTELPAGTFYAQAVFHRYETFTLANGKTVKLPMNRGAGQNWRRAPGNLFSAPLEVTLTDGEVSDITLALSDINPPIEKPVDTKYVRYVEIESKLLSEFWGRPIMLAANVLVPEGFDENPDMRYPLGIFHGHFSPNFQQWSTEPPSEEDPCIYSGRFGVDCYNRVFKQAGYDFYQQWIKPDHPRMLLIEIQHANPYYDDSYAVNSANLGPYGDAITYELIPYIEEQFNGIGEGWARFMYGGSTGGWESLAVQTFYPDDYNGAFVACPDPIDFRAFMTANIYADTNLYYKKGPFKTLARPAFRDYLGHVSATMEMMNHYELVIGDKHRSGDQFDIWGAVFGPNGEDGYPVPLYNKLTGEIDPVVADYWRENYDLRHILERDWATLGPKLHGKLHIYTGDMDNFYLNNATYLMEEFLETADPPYGGVVDYGDRAEHCWNGDHDNPNHLSRLRYHTLYLPRILERIRETAPVGADLRFLNGAP